MLADSSEHSSHAGMFDADLHLPGEWLTSLIAFIASTLVGWRDDPRRPAETGETRLTAQLCSRLNSVARHSGWDHCQFKREEPDESNASRSIDLIVAPRGTIIWLEGREYSEYQTLLPIECKRLPTPIGRDRDAREYLFSEFSSTGGVDRFKFGRHGAKHLRAAMIGYVQDKDVIYWQDQLKKWVLGLSASGAAGWSAADDLLLIAHDLVAKFAHLQSAHNRSAPLDSIHIDHLWIEM